ncbi:hypothetical protein [Pelagibacterium limicola]|uniref:hypothetical protein n=1 Tax=Pelagibacterium limicola TaxID=2791022 RepID=UPI0018AF8737|nr:hypothetical protein [Pelagibacterium limicola]
MDATPHIIESALFLLVAFLLGCVVGYLARRIAASRAPALVPAADPVAAAEQPARSSESAVSADSVSPTPKGKAPRAGRKASVPGSSQRARKTVATSSGPADDLKKIRGIGPRLEANLQERGITHYDQIAKLTKKATSELDAELNLRGRIEREQWVEQAKALMKAGK